MDIQAHPDRLQSPFLTDNILAGLNALGALKGQVIRVASPPELLNRNFVEYSFWHGFPVSWCELLVVFLSLYQIRRKVNAKKRE
jgi:hypothetical protein